MKNEKENSKSELYENSFEKTDKKILNLNSRRFFMDMNLKIFNSLLNNTSFI
ncbi:hypothetical protein LCGC14_2208490 [marine sediment metagenome]|uniref:Uncharacterized protein n=1 Tax=marine sediment metagenome TaxID=412755 RepID=A0A0F9E1Z6_9ZZZZ